jgi:hypothetical protein
MDRIQLIDTAVKTQWLDDYAPLVKDDDGVSASVWVVTARRESGELYNKAVDTDVRQTNLDSERLRVPRIALWRQNIAPDPTRQIEKHQRIRNMAPIGSGGRASYSGAYPIPVNIEYQVDFWTNKISAMNVWEVQFADQFRSQTHYIKITVDDFWKNKWVCLRTEAGLEDNSELEPGEDHTIYRKTARVTACTWIFPTSESLRVDPSVLQVILDVYKADAIGVGTPEFIERLIAS